MKALNRYWLQANLDKAAAAGQLDPFIQSYQKLKMVRAALKRPVTVLVLFLGLLLFSVAAVRNIPIDIFPKLNLPTIMSLSSTAACR